MIRELWVRVENPLVDCANWRLATMRDITEGLKGKIAEMMTAQEARAHRPKQCPACKARIESTCWAGAIRFAIYKCGAKVAGKQDGGRWLWSWDEVCGKYK